MLSVLTRALYNLSLVFIDFRITLVIHLDLLCLYLQYFIILVVICLGLAYNNNFSNVSLF